MIETPPSVQWSNQEIIAEFGGRVLENQAWSKTPSTGLRHPSPSHCHNWSSHQVLSANTVFRWCSKGGMFVTDNSNYIRHLFFFFFFFFFLFSFLFNSQIAYTSTNKNQNRLNWDRILFSSFSFSSYSGRTRLMYTCMLRRVVAASTVLLVP